MQENEGQQIVGNRRSRLGKLRVPYQFIEEGTLGERLTDLMEQAVEAEDLRSAVILNSWIIGIITDQFTDLMSASIASQEQTGKLISSVIDQLEGMEGVDAQLHSDIESLSNQLHMLSQQSNRLYKTLVNQGRGS